VDDLPVFLIAGIGGRGMSSVDRPSAALNVGGVGLPLAVLYAVMNVLVVKRARSRRELTP